jgi:hypothetical protein
VGKAASLADVIWFNQESAPGAPRAGTPTRRLPARGCNRSGVTARYTANVQIEYFDELFAP